MSDEEDREAQTRARLETSADRANMLGKWGKTILLACAIVLTIGIVILIYKLIPAVDAWKKGNRATAEQVPMIVSELHDVITEIHEKIKGVDATKLNTMADEGVKDEQALKALLDTLNKSAGKITSGLSDEFVSFRKVTDEAGAQFKNIGDGLTKLLTNSEPNVTKATGDLAKITGSLAESAKVVEDGLKDPKVKDFIDDTLKRGTSILGNFDKVSGDLTLISEDGKKITTHLAGISDNFDAMSAESRAKLSEILHPPAAHGFLGHAKQVIMFFIRPVAEGFRIYEAFASLPVRITQSVPLFTPKP